MKVTDEMVNRFLSWRLPQDFMPDGGITFKPLNHPDALTHLWPVGTNLLTADQARKMFEHVLAPLLAELEQERDIRSDREITLSMVADGLGVEPEPHQTFDERLLEASTRTLSAVHGIPEGQGSAPAGALVTGSPPTVAPGVNPGSAVPGGGGYPRDNAIEAAREPTVLALAWKAAFGNETLKHPDQSTLAHAFLAIASELEWRERCVAESANSTTLGQPWSAMSSSERAAFNQGYAQAEKDRSVATVVTAALVMAKSTLQRWADLYGKLSESYPKVRQMDYNLPPAEHVRTMEAIDVAIPESKVRR